LIVFSAAATMPAFSQRVVPMVNSDAMLAAVASPAAFVASVSAASFLPASALSVAAESRSSVFDAGLPEEPSADPKYNATPCEGNAAQAAPVTGAKASIYTKTIPAGWRAEPLTARDKMILGYRDLYSFTNIAGILITAEYDYAIDGQPNFGVNGEAFGKRLSANAIFWSSEGVFTDTVFAPLLHEDSRYYVEGSGFGLIHRTLYAITRPLITRTDSGRATLNGALLLGYASSSLLTDAYYPHTNRNVHDTVSTFGGSIGGAALAFFISEFTSEVLVKLHLVKQE
jgi:hypothetical protein